MPIELQGDPLLLFMHAANKIALYGPSWILFSSIPYFLGFGNFFLTLLNFKLFVAGFYIGSLVILWKLTKNLKAVYLFGLNPLVLTETLVSGHNDIVMICFALLSFSLLLKRKFVSAIVLILVSIFIKYATLFLLPTFCYVFFKKIKREKIKEERVFYYSALLMFFAFLLSPIREEIYPWYAIWFLPFISLSGNKKLIMLSLSLSFGLMLRYVPFMFYGTYFGRTPLLKELLTFAPVIIVLLLMSIKKIWSKNSFLL